VKSNEGEKLTLNKINMVIIGFITWWHWASASSTSKLVCGVFSSCYSRWSRRLSLQSNINNRNS